MTIHSFLSGLLTYQQQSGAVGACWTHNPEVRGSKPRSANESPLCQNGIVLLNFQNLIEQNYLEEKRLFFLLERVVNINEADSKCTNVDGHVGFP